VKPDSLEGQFGGKTGNSTYLSMH